MPDSKPSIDGVLEFWFGRAESAREIAAQKSKQWWEKDAAVDAEIRARFAEMPDAIAAGAHAEWQTTARGTLALIICTDQFPRNLHRNSPNAFAHDALALQFAKQCDAESLRPIERVFAYLPFEHSEVLAEQERSLKLFRALADDAPAGERELFENYFQFAQRHYDIVKRFGRFPHRNAALGRESTPEEVAFLREPGSSF